MDKVWMMILILSVLFFAYLTAEAVRARQNRKKLQHVIYVNGTRGKSTVSRLIAAGLAAGGYRVMCKTTGTLPLCLHPDGREEEIRRRGPANIREQLKYLHAAAEEKADILVIECMALQPEYQRVSARNMLRNDIGVITNARLDHMDVMGETRGEILDCLMEMLPEGKFVRIHRSYIVPAWRIEKRTASAIKLMGIQEPLPVGRAYKEELKSNK